MRISVIGATGYGGVELVRLIHSHPEFEIQSLHSTSGDGGLEQSYPHLASISTFVLEPIDVQKISEKSDIVFLATPSGVSSQLAQDFFDLDSGIKIIDLSGDLRLKKSDDYARWYDKEPASEKILSEAVYGLSDWNTEKISQAHVIANPGCYPTASLLGLAPIVQADVVDPSSIIIDAKSGTSGAGRNPSTATMLSEMSENFKAYKLNTHQHVPEIEQQLAVWNNSMQSITFTPHLLPMSRGLMATEYVTIDSSSFKATQDSLYELYDEAYRDRPFIRLRPSGEVPAIKEVSGSNYCDIGIDFDPRTNRLTIISVIDNLIKGAAGQAVQNANIMSGFEETTGLNFLPLYP